MQLDASHRKGKQYRMQKSLYLRWHGVSTDMHRSDEISVGDNVFFRGREYSSGRRLSYKTEADQYMSGYRVNEKAFSSSGVTRFGIVCTAAVLILIVFFVFCFCSHNANSAALQVRNLESTLATAQTRHSQLLHQTEEAQTDMVVLKKVIDQSEMISSKGVSSTSLTVSQSSIILPDVGSSTGESLFAIAQMK